MSHLQLLGMLFVVFYVIIPVLVCAWGVIALIIAKRSRKHRKE